MNFAGLINDHLPIPKRQVQHRGAVSTLETTLTHANITPVVGHSQAAQTKPYKISFADDLFSANVRPKERIVTRSDYCLQRAPNLNAAARQLYIFCSLFWGIDIFEYATLEEVLLAQLDRYTAEIINVKTGVDSPQTFRWPYETLRFIGNTDRIGPQGIDPDVELPLGPIRWTTGKHSEARVSFYFDPVGQQLLTETGAFMTANFFTTVQLRHVFWPAFEKTAASIPYIEAALRNLCKKELAIWSAYAPPNDFGISR